MNRLLCLPVAFALLSSSAFAGGYVEPAAPPVIVPVEAGTDWSGFYAGFGFGHADFTDDFGPDDSTAQSIFAGYLHDMGSIVVGGEVRHQWLSNFSGTADQTDTLDSLLGRVGYDAGRILPYAYAGVALYDSSGTNGAGLDIAADDTFLVYGVGVDFQATDSIRIGLTADRATGTDVVYSIGGAPSPATDVTIDTFALRVAYNF